MGAKNDHEEESAKTKKNSTFSLLTSPRSYAVRTGRTASRAWRSLRDLFPLVSIPEPPAHEKCSSFAGRAFGEANAYEIENFTAAWTTGVPGSGR